jgi:hypothetical protein
LREKSNEECRRWEDLSSRERGNKQRKIRRALGIPVEKEEKEKLLGRCIAPTTGDNEGSRFQSKERRRQQKINSCNRGQVGFS